MPKAQALNVEVFEGACARGDLAKVKSSLKKDRLLAQGWNPIIKAASAGHAKVVELLLQSGADPNAESPSEYHYRPLHRAICAEMTSERLDIMALLVAAGADIESRGLWYRATPLNVAAITGSPQTVKFLLGRGALVDAFSASALGNIHKLRMLLDGDPGATIRQDNNEMTPLQYCAASRLGCTDNKVATNLLKVAKTLIDAGASVTGEQDEEGRPKMGSMYWAARNNLPVLRLLLERGANANEALHSAARVKAWTAVELLLEYGADINVRDHEGATSLYRAAYVCHTDDVAWLLAHGADPNLTGPKGWTPLQAAASKGTSPRTVELLLKHGSRINVRDDEGRTALVLARGKGRHKIVDLLKQHGSK